MWELIEQLLSQLPTRDFVQSTVSGVLDKATQTFRAMLPVKQPDPLSGNGQSQELADALSQIAERLKSLGDSDPAKSQVESLLEKLVASKDFQSQPHDEKMARIGKVFEFLDILAAQMQTAAKAQSQNASQSTAQQPKSTGRRRARSKPQPTVATPQPKPQLKQQPRKPSVTPPQKPAKPAVPKVTSPRQQSKPTPAASGRGFKPAASNKTAMAMQRFGRRLQMWGGRLSAMPGRLPAMAGRGLARAGMTLQGMGRAGAAVAGLGTAGVTVAGFVVAIGAAVAAVIGFVKGTKAAGEGLLEQQRRFAGLSMGQSQAMGMTTLNKLQNDIRTAQGTETMTLELAREMSEFRDAMQPLDQLVTNLELAVVSKLVDASTAVVNGLTALGEPILALVEEAVKFKVSLSGGNIQMQNAAAAAVRAALAPAPNQPQIPLHQMFQNLRNPPPAAGRPPIQPIP